MSFIISVYINGGIVMAADSRLTLNAKIEQGGSTKDISFDFSNSTYKLFMNKKGVGVSTCGDAGIGSSPIAGYIEQFLLENHQDDVDAIANKLLAHFNGFNQKLNTTFHVTGYKEGKQKVYRVSTALNSVTQTNLALQGASWDGEVDIFQRIVNDAWLSDKDGKTRVENSFVSNSICVFLSSRCN
jgi:hypothetical protein